MKLIYLLTTPDSGAGTERTMLTQAELMASHHDVRVVGVLRTANRPHFALDRRVRMSYLVDHRSPSNSRPSRLVPREWDNQFSEETDRALARFLRRVHADVIITSTPALAALAAEFAPDRIRIVHQEHRSSMNRDAGLMPLISHGARLDLITSLTERSQEWLRDRLGESAPRLEVVENPLTPGPKPRSSLSHKLIVSAGRFNRGKRFDHLIRAFEVANAIEPGWKLRIYGSGPDQGPLMSLVWRTRLEGLVEIVEPTRRLPAELSKASIFAMSSRHEGLPMVGIEAAAAGVPLVAYDVLTGPAEIVGKAGGGILAPDGSIPGLGANLALLMSDRALLGEYSSRALAGAEAFSPATIRTRWEEVLDSVLDRGSAAPLTHTSHDNAIAADEVRARAIGVSEAATLDALSQFRLIGEQRRYHELTVDRMISEVCAKLGGYGVRVGVLAGANAPGQLCIGTEDQQRGTAAVFQAAADHGWEIEILRNGRPIASPWRHPDQIPPATRLATQLRVRGGFDEPPPSGLLVSRPREDALVVGFWAEDSAGLRAAPSVNDQVDWLDAAAWQRIMDPHNGTVSGLPHWHSVAFPIDVVYTWVDGSDPAHAKRRREHLRDTKGASTALDATRDARFLSRDELYYSVLGVKRFMPWVRNIFVVTDQQVPTRVADRFPDVEIVDHRDIFPNVTDLPTFNSHAIEACLHRIDGLSEHFLYFNDDVIPVRPISPTRMFTPNGLAKFFPSPVKINYGGLEAFPHLAAASNNRDLILRDFGIEITNSMLHTPYAHRRSVIIEMEDRYRDEFETTRRSRFRGPNDFSVPSSFASYYGYATSRYVRDQVAFRFVSLRSARLAQRLTSIVSDPSLEFIALGEPTATERAHRHESRLLPEFLTALVGD